MNIITTNQIPRDLIPRVISFQYLNQFSNLVQKTIILEIYQSLHFF